MRRSLLRVGAKSLKPSFGVRWAGSKAASERAISLETEFGAHNYHPVPVVISKGKGAEVWDAEGNHYLDFLAAYSAVNQGHCHPRIVETLTTQAQKLTLTSRAFYNDLLGEYCEFVTKFFGYDRLLPMNTGVEACESAVKIARRWAYEKKGIAPNEALVCFAEENFWGRSISAISASTDPVSYTNYGPFVPNFHTVPYNDIEAISKYVRDNADRMAAVMLEPIQGEAGVIIPDKDYLKQVRALCDEVNCLLIIDEVQTGMGRCGADLCGEGVFGVKADLVSMGKALSGGVYPVSAVIGSHETVGVLTPGSHGSTYGGNPLGCQVAMTALKVLREEKLPQRSLELGQYLLAGLKEIEKEFALVTTVRGQGLFCALEILTDESKKVTAWEVCLQMAANGVLAKPTHGHIIRLSPPLVISKSQLDDSLETVRKALVEVSKRL